MLKNKKDRKSKDRATRKLSEYVVDNNISLKDICRETGLEYHYLNSIINLGERDLSSEEFLEICGYIDEDPRKFK